MENILVSLFKNNMFKKYPQPIGTEVNEAREIISKYFITLLSGYNLNNSKISLKESGASSAVMQSEAGNVVGGIDFRKIEYLTRPMGSFQGLDLRLPLLLRLCRLKEERGVETTPDFRAVLMIADTGLFVAQGKEKHSLN